MENAKIKPGHIYFVDYDPVRPGEFGQGRHLALVLNQNVDSRTYISIPLTSKSNGGHMERVDLGYLKCLPWKMRQNKTYAVVCQMRSVSPSRITPIFCKNGVKDVELPEGRMKKIKEAIFKTFLEC